MMKPTELVKRQVKSAEFSFYKDRDVRDRSVVEITSHQAFDPTHNPLPNGLYDLRLGPSKETEPPCPTCGLRATYCPGHFGHIELAVPVYHPLLIVDLVTLLRIKCLSCHRLRGPPRRLSILRAKFNLLYLHKIQQFHDLDQEIMYVTRDNRNEDDKFSPRIAQALDAFLRDLQPNPDILRKRPHFNSMERQLHKELVQEVFATCKNAKACAFCGAFSPKLRHDAHNKIFQAPLAQKSDRLNKTQGNYIKSALIGEGEDGYNSEDSRQNTDHVEDSDASDEEEDDEDALPTTKDKFMHTAEVRAQAKRTWQTDPFLLNSLFGPGTFEEDGYNIFFLQAVPVPPSRFRPPMHLSGMAVEHSQTQYLSKMLQLNETIRNFMVDKNEPRAYQTWIDLQTTVNCFMDSSKDPSSTPSNQIAPGIKQILERKEGLFRKNMMGKRVDYACRSVISPDPYIGTNEIGLPRYFATTLTFPTPVTDLNVKEMRSLVERGPHNYPGARWVEIQGRRVDLGKMSDQKRDAVAAQLLTHLKKGGKPAVVGRQLRDGDYVLMNRQPSLHKPSIMAHRVRVLHSPTQKTIRMHYANCNTYNADYDGDEMNGHFPQSELARAEAIHIARTDLQYIVPTDGSPLRGLIQDHVVGGVKLTKRDTFLKKWEYQQLLFSCLSCLPGIEVIRSDARIELLPPAILKPEPLWTGKQIISTILLHLRKGSDRDPVDFKELTGVSTERKAKTPATAFCKENEEHLVLVRDGELLRGVLDKAAFGATDFSLVHAVYEAYGPERAGLLLNSFGRLFTAYIQFYSGHSCRVEDLVLTKNSEKERRRLVQRAYNLGARAAKAWADSDGGKIPIDIIENEKSDEALKPVEKASTAASIGALLSGNDGKQNFAALDSFMQGQLNPLSSAIVKKCLPDGLAVPFPHNTFGIMTMTGAKGSIVNQSQVSCALGQQALEGRRVPRMNSGRTLPSFAPYDPNPRADGFVLDRFLTGIRPQEYYFHCMAGREGLVDTAVKTSRSGYLQRCLMKHMEELRVHYDFTVRNAEGGVIQFLYGEDGLDPTKSSFLDCKSSSFEFLARNHRTFKSRFTALPDSSLDRVIEDLHQIENESNPEIQAGDWVQCRRLSHGNQWKHGCLLEGWYEARVIEAYDNSYFDVCFEDGSVLRGVPREIDLGTTRKDSASTLAVIVRRFTPDPILSSSRKEHRFGVNGTCVSERLTMAARDELKTNKSLKLILSAYDLSPKHYGSLVASKFTSSICAPGEAVGCIAAQSVGEPSTQMTLNTFHLAGAGANVTLGIPRLREIIMTASKELKTPTMSVPLLPFVDEAGCGMVARDFSKLTLMELLSNDNGIEVVERIEQFGNEWYRTYYISLKFYSTERIGSAFGLGLKRIARVVGKSFVPDLSKRMAKELNRSISEQKGLEVFGGDPTDVIEASGENNSPTSPASVDELDDNENGDDDSRTEEDGVEYSRKRRESVSYESDDEQSGPIEEPQEIDTLVDSPMLVQSEPQDLLQRTKDTRPTIDESAGSIRLQPLRVDPSAPPLLMVGLIEAAASACLVKSTKRIEQAFINTEENRGKCLQTTGVNFEEIWKLESVDHSKLVSNDIWAIRCAYGVEAARCSIVEQIRGVFGVYGIEVDPRHLTLIADYMTFEGGFKAMNRVGIDQTSSTFLQMSFETTVHFLRQAATGKHIDMMDSPSANIVLGKPVRHGTGSFELLSTFEKTRTKT